MSEVKAEELPKKIRDIYNKGYAAMERGRTDFAMDMFLLALEHEPRFLRARELVRRIEIKDAKEKKTLAGISTITGLGGVMAVKKSIKKDAAKAMLQAEDLLRRDIKNIQFVDLFCEAAVAAEIPEAAAQTLDIISRELMPENSEILEKLGAIYTEMGWTKQARDTYQELVRRDPNNQKALKMMKDAAARHTMSDSGYEKAVETNDFRAALGNSDQAAELERMNKAQQSESDLERNIGATLAKIEKDPENLNLYRALADLYNKAEEYDQAREALEKAYDLSGRADPEIDRGISRMNVKIYQSNIDYYKAEGMEAEALEAEQDLFNFRLHDVRDCVERYPSDNVYKFELGKLLYEQGDVSESIPLFQKSRTHPKVRQEALFYLALCFKARGTLDLAIETLEEALKEIVGMTHVKKDILYEVGLIKESMDDASGAMDAFKQIYQVEYGYKDVAERIEGRKG